MDRNSGKNSLIKSESFLIFILSSIPLLLHIYTNAFAGYGIFRDEFYYLSCTSRLDLGYVDQPPFSIYILAIVKSLLGDSVFAIRLLPTILNAVIVFLCGKIVKELGGGKLAITYACIAVALAPIILGMHSIYSMNIFDFLFWTLSFYLIIKIVKDENPKFWIYLGLFLGFGLLNKIGMLWFCMGLFGGLLLTKERKSLKTISPWMTALITLIIFSPYIIWNFTHDFAHIEFIQNASKYKYSGISIIDFITGQFLTQNPGSAIIWLAGIYYFFFNKEGKKYIIIGLIYAAAFLILILNGTSKAEYLSPAYPVLFAGGGILLEKINMRKSWKWFKYVVIIPLIISGVIFIPIVLPILPIEKYIKYAGAIGFGPSTSEGKELSELPQFYADMFGWEDMALTVSSVFTSLPEEQRKNTVVYGMNYGEAGAMEYFSKKYPLPDAVSPHNNFYYWSLGTKYVNTVIIIGGRKDYHLNDGTSVEIKAIHNSKYVMPYENNLPIFVVTDLIRSMDDIMHSDSHYE